MSEHGFHVHGPHDHEMEHAAQHGDDPGEGHRGIGGHSLTNQVALFTAIISTAGAMFSYMGGATQADALLYKNNSQIKTTEASDQWNFYQSKSSKQNLSELAAAIVADDKKDFYRKEIDRYKGEKAEVMLAAKKLEAEAKAWDEKSEAQMHVHHRWAQATTLIQVSIALAAIALLTRKKWLEWGMVGVGGAGIVVGALAGLHV
ncbi:MAG TPA: DUF4337 domain-containing protein [Ramlibacter sp.]|jgi:hypothetical protein